MSEKQRLIPDRGEDIAEEHESNGSESPPPSDEKSSLTTKIRRRASPPSGSNYGTISDIKYQPLVGPGGAGGGTTSKSHFTRKQTLIAVIAFLLFASGVAVTLILGLPRLEAKRKEYFEAKFFESPLEVVSYNNKAILLNSAPECSKLALDQGSSVLDSGISAILCSLISSPHLIRPDSRITGLYFRNGTFHEISTKFHSIQIKNRQVATPTLFYALYKIHQNFPSESNLTTILQSVARLAQNGIPMTATLAEEINKNLEKKYKWKNDFLQVNTSPDGAVTPGQTVKNPALAQFLTAINDTNVLTLLEDEISINFGSLINITKPEIRFSTPLQTSFFNTTILSPNNGAGFMMNRFLRIQASLNEKFDQCLGDDSRTLKEGTQEFHYLIETLKHSLQALSSNQTDTQQNILQRAKQIFDIQENSLSSPNEAKTYGYNGDISNAIKNIQKQSQKRSFQMLIHDTQSGDALILVAQNRKNLFEGNKFASKAMGFILDIFDEDDKDLNADPQASPMIVLDSASNSVKYLLSSEYEACSAVAQVFSKLTLGCESLKGAIDESRIFFSPKKNQVYLEDKFPRAYIDLLMRLYGHLNIEPTSKSEQLSSVFAIKAEHKSASLTFEMAMRRLQLFFDWRSRGEGFLNGN